MNKKEVENKIGKENWDLFCRWIYGQTYGMNDDGTPNYFECDVYSFLYKIKTGYDRQTDPLLWD